MTMEIFLTAAGTVTTADATDAAYSLMFTITDNANKEVSVKIGSKKPASNSNAHLVIPATVAFNGVNETFKVTAIEDNAFMTCYNFGRAVKHLDVLCNNLCFAANLSVFFPCAGL